MRLQKFVRNCLQKSSNDLRLTLDLRQLIHIDGSSLSFTSCINLTYLTLFTWWFMSKSLLFGYKVESRIVSLYSFSHSIGYWSIIVKFNFKFELTYFALSLNLTIFSGTSFLIACFSINQGEISSLTSSDIFESRLVCSFIITQVLLFHVLCFIKKWWLLIKLRIR